MSTPTLHGITETIEVLDAAIDEMRGQRSGYTSRLESMAHEWDRLYPQARNTPWDRLGCSACHFRYMRVKDGDVHFGTVCSYCGPDGGSGIAIPATWFERALVGDQVESS